MAFTEDQRSRIADAILDAAERKHSIEPLSDTYPDITTQDAYQIQLSNVQRRVASGRKIVGKKIGLTSPAMQQLFNVMEPDYGHLFDDMLYYQGEAVHSGKFLQPRIEGEIAFVLARDLTGPGITPTEVLRATAGLVAALEIVDSRIRDWKIKIQDTVADNASSGAFVIGSKMVSAAGMDTRHVGFVFAKNGRVAGTAAGAAVLGSPIQAVAWLANKMGEYGIGLKAGEIILSGAACAAVPVQTGDSIHLVVDRVGEVSCFFD